MTITPYVGPAPLNNEQVLFGRDAEVDELQWRLAADRIIVLYSPSGAGKTSLLSAQNGLLARVSPRFRATPILRVCAGLGVAPTLAILQQLTACGYGEIRAEDTLSDYFDRIQIPDSKPPKRVLLVIDQFEEIFSNERSSAEQREFFAQLGQLLSREKSPVWAIFSMREEFFSWLDPFRDSVPTRLSNTVRLNLLNKAQAIEAVRGPAKAIGVSFPKEDGVDAAYYLVTELSKVRVRGLDGAVEIRTVDRIEAVQLQVICVDLWQRLSKDGRTVQTICISDVSQYKPDSALQGYCDDALEAAASNPDRAGILRNWIDQRLLTPGGLRAPAMIDPGEKSDPTPDEIFKLEERHLIRRQTREDGAWYELSHDSLAVPVRKSIERWLGQNLTPWQHLARAYRLGGKRLAFFKSLSAGSQQNIPAFSETNQYTEDENSFLADFHDYQRQKRRFRLFVSATCAMVAVVLFLLFDNIKREAVLVAQRNDTAVQAGVLAILSGNPGIGLRARAAVAGTTLQEKNSRAVAFNFRSVLSDFLYQNRNIEALESEGNGTSKATVLDRDYRVVAEIGEERYLVEVSDRAAHGRDWKIDPALVQKIHPLGVRSICLMANGKLATGGGDGSIQIWDIKAQQPDGMTLYAVTSRHAPLMHGPVRVLVSNGELLYAGYERGVVAAWSLSSPREESSSLAWTHKVPSRVSGLAFSPDGNYLAVADISADEHIALLTVVGGKSQVGVDPHSIELVASPKEGNYRGAFYSVAFSPDGRRVAAGNRAGRIHVWNVATKSHVLQIAAHEQTVTKLGFLQDGSLLSIGWDGRIKRWTLPRDESSPPSSKLVLDLGRQLAGIAVEPDESSAFVTSRKGDVLQVALGPKAHPLGQVRPWQGFLSYLVGEGSKLSLITVANDSVKIEGLDHPSAVARPHNLGQLDGIVGAARAGAIKTTFVASNNQVMGLRDGDPAGAPLHVLDGLVENIESVHVNDNGTSMIIRTKDHTTLWSLQKPDLKATPCDTSKLPVTFPAKATRLVVYRPGSSAFITVANGIAQFWKSYEHAAGCPDIREDLTRLGKHGAEIQTAVFDPTGKTLWAGDFAGRLYSVDVDSKVPVEVPLQDESVTPPSALAVSAGHEQHVIAVGDASGGIYVFQPGSTIPVRLAQDFHDTEIRSLSLSPDGRWLASSSSAGTAIWDLNIDKWVERACFLANHRSFSESDLQKYFSRVSEKPTPCSLIH